jgi:hypothetical protein
LSVDNDERKLLSASLRSVIRDNRAQDLKGALETFGWFDLLVQDVPTAATELCILQGELLTDTTFIDDIVLTAAGRSTPARVVYPGLTSTEPATHLTSVSLVIDGLVSGPLTHPLVVPARTETGVALVCVPAPELIATTAAIDPDGPWRRVQGEVDLGQIVVTDATDDPWPTMRSAGQCALAAEVYGIGTRMLTLAVEHVRQREQFGRTLGSFQAVKHLLADVRLWQECAGLAVLAAWEDADPTSAALAKVISSRFMRLAAAHCQQVLGGMGFTWEHDFHKYLRRGLVLEPILGSSSHLRTALGKRIQQDGVPELAAL